jgi:hypothetical protein
MRTLNSIIFLLVLSIPTFASVRYITPKSKTPLEVLKWEVVDIPFKVNAKNIQNPFTVEFSAQLIGPGNTAMNIPGFYNGNGEWVIRLSLSVPGKWTYKTSSPLKELANKMGTLTVSSKAKVGDHGGIIVDPKNPKHFIYEDETPYFLLAYECDWLYALDYQNDKGTPKTDHFLDLLAGNGCTQIVMNLFTFDVSWPKDKKLLEHPDHDLGGPKGIFPFLGNNDNPDYSSLNVEFFKKFDRTISLMHDRGLASHLMIYVWNKLVNWPGMNTEADNLYFDYAVKRYQAFPNMVFDISKEALAYGRADDNYIKERIERLQRLNAYKRLVTVHDFGFCKRFPDIVDFISMQSWSSTIYNLTLTTGIKYTDKPIFNIEHGGYEESPYQVWTGDFTDPEVCLRRNYHIVFGGAYSTYYWQGCSWNVLIYNPFEQNESFIKPKFEYYKHMKDFFTKHDLSTLKPDPDKNGSAYCLSGNKEKYLFYVSKENYMIQPNFLKKTAYMRSYTWFNTLTGEYLKLNSDSLAVGDKKIISDWQGDIHLESPWKGKADAILVTDLLPEN